MEPRGGGQKNVLLTFNKAYLYAAGNLILTLNKYNENLFYYIFFEKADEEAINYLFSLGAKIRLYDFEINADFDTKNWHPVQTVRLFAPYLIGDDIEKLLYLDDDMLCKGNIDAMFNLKDDNCVLAMTPDLGLGCNYTNRSSLFDDCFADLYCNAGVILIYVKRYKQNQTLDSLLDDFSSLAERLTFLDQDYLNYRFKGKIHFLKQDYDLLMPLISRYNYKKMIGFTKLLHFNLKPWNRTTPHLIKKTYIKYSLEKHVNRKVRIAMVKGFFLNKPLYLLFLIYQPFKRINAIRSLKERLLPRNH